MSPSWHSVPSAPGYEVNSTGTEIRHLNAPDGEPRYLTLSDVYPPNNRYRRVWIIVDGVPRFACFHQLVLEAFQGPRPPGMPVARHLDGNPLNNDPWNLRWGTHAENAADKAAHRRLRQALDHAA